MTTNVPKGAGRATATAKRNKHAQRTPLPPKAGSPGAEAIAEAKAYRRATDEERAASTFLSGEEKREHEILNHDGAACPSDCRTLGEESGQERAESYGRMTVDELRARAKQLLVTGISRMNKGKLLNAILEAEKAQASTAERLAGRDVAAEVFETAAKIAEPKAPSPEGKPKKAVTPAPETPAPVSEGQAKSIAKAEAFVKAAADLGWAEFSRSAPDQETYGVIVGRGEERIAISWRSGVFAGEECYHSHPARTPRKVINASAAKKIMAIPAAQADEEARKVTANKSARPRRDRGGEATTGRRSALPFTEASLDQEVLDALYGRRISWTNTISGETEEERVPQPSESTRLTDGTPGRRKVHHAPRIKEGPRGRVLEFLGNSGFRAVLLSSIVSVR